MDLLPEIWCIMVPYFTLQQLNLFRLLSRELCGYTKRHEAPDEVASPYFLDLFLRCYPNIKRLDIGFCHVLHENFSSFSKLEELSCQSDYLTHNTLFKPCVQLKHLFLHSDYFYQYTNLDPMFKHLPQLTLLSMRNVEKITEAAFHFSNKITDLEILGRSSITSIRSLKQLKTLTIDTYTGVSHIRDDAFEGLPIEELYLHSLHFITDRGICHMKQLRKVICIKVPHVQGEGWLALKQLETIGFGGTTLHKVSNFKMAKTLSFHESRILGPWRGLWTKLEKLRVHNTTFEYPESIKTIMCPHLRKIRIIRCRQMMDYESLLCKTFGKKLSIRM